MAYATQITVITGMAGRRTLRTFTLGAESSAHREQIRHLLPLDVFDEIEGDADTDLEVDVNELTQALRVSNSLIDMIEDAGLRESIIAFRDFWFTNLGKPKAAFVGLS